jgi:hypothetical protein
VRARSERIRRHRSGSRGDRPVPENGPEPTVTK